MLDIYIYIYFRMITHVKYFFAIILSHMFLFSFDLIARS